MTRYARSSGVKGQNKLAHSSTPWSSLKPTQNRESKSNKLNKCDKKYRNIKKKPEVEPLTLPTKIPKTIKPCEGIAAVIEQVPQETIVTKSMKGKKKEKKKSSNEMRQKIDKMKEDYERSGKKLTNEEINEIETVCKKAERSEQRRLKRAEDRMSHKVCFKCRQAGHDMSSCPSMKRDVESGTGICFKCGSTEHLVNRCPVKLPPGHFPYAKCFICGETGHLSKQCPDNPRGLYPNGGCCGFCGSVEHYKSSCPEMLKKQGIQDFKLHQWYTSSADDDLLLNEEKPPPVKKFKPKVVKF